MGCPSTVNFWNDLRTEAVLPRPAGGVWAISSAGNSVNPATAPITNLRVMSVSGIQGSKSAIRSSASQISESGRTRIDVKNDAPELVSLGRRSCESSTEGDCEPGVAGRVVAAGLTPPIDTDIVVPIDELVSRLCRAG